MQKLLTSELFDAFETTEGSLTTFASFHVDGAFRSEYFDSSSEETLSDHVHTPWKLLRPFFYELIRGKYPPLKFRLIFRYPDHLMKDLPFLSSTLDIPLSYEDVNGLYLTITYEQKKVRLITGCSLKVFTLDKKTEHGWDDYICSLLRRIQIPFS